MTLDFTADRPGHALTTVDTTWLGLLAPEEIVAWQPAEVLLASLSAGVASRSDHELFTAANRLALELYRAGEIASAERLCRLQIAYAGLRVGGRTDPVPLLRGLQPAINLIRMHGYAGTLALGLEGLSRLEAIADGAAVDVFGAKIPDAALALKAPGSAHIKAFARANCIVETTKVLFRRGLTDAWVEESRRLSRKWPGAKQDGPFHAHESLVVNGVDEPTDEPCARRFAAIAEVHRLGRSDVAHRRRSARGMFDRRETSRLDNDLAQARFVAVLAELLASCGEGAPATACFREAVALSAPLDPRLAAKIHRRWAQYDTDAGPGPSVRDAGSAQADDLLTVAAQAERRLT